jgi:hypothetical protein
MVQNRFKLLDGTAMNDVFGLSQDSQGGRVQRIDGLANIFWMEVWSLCKCNGSQ